MDESYGKEAIKIAGGLVGGNVGGVVGVKAGFAVAGAVAAVSGPFAILTVPLALVGCIGAGAAFGMYAGYKNPAAGLLGGMGVLGDGGTNIGSDQSKV